MDQLKELQEQLALQHAPDKELTEVLEKLKDIRKRFETGEFSERELMLQLARLNENLRQKANELGCVLSPKTQGNMKGGLKAGIAASGESLGEADRLQESYRQLVRVFGQAGSGPVETENEVTVRFQSSEP